MGIIYTIPDNNRSDPCITMHETLQRKKFAIFLENYCKFYIFIEILHKVFNLVDTNVTIGYLLFGMTPDSEACSSPVWLILNETCSP